jgi:hypothetical protein
VGGIKLRSGHLGPHSLDFFYVSGVPVGSFGPSSSGVPPESQARPP